MLWMPIALKGARLGVVRNAYGPNDNAESAEVSGTIDSALEKANGVEAMSRARFIPAGLRI